MKMIEHIQRHSYEQMMKKLEDGSVTPMRVLSSYEETQDVLSNMLIGACQAIADYTRKAEE